MEDTLIRLTYPQIKLLAFLAFDFDLDLEEEEQALGLKLRAFVHVDCK